MSNRHTLKLSPRLAIFWNKTSEKKQTKRLTWAKCQLCDGDSAPALPSLWVVSSKQFLSAVGLELLTSTSSSAWPTWAPWGLCFAPGPGEIMNFKGGSIVIFRESDWSWFEGLCRHENKSRPLAWVKSSLSVRDWAFEMWLVHLYDTACWIQWSDVFLGGRCQHAVEKEVPLHCLKHALDMLCKCSQMIVAHVSNMFKHALCLITSRREGISGDLRLICRAEDSNKKDQTCDMHWHSTSML